MYLHDAALAQRATLGALSNGTSSVVTPKRCLAFSQTSSPLRSARGGGREARDKGSRLRAWGTRW